MSSPERTWRGCRSPTVYVRENVAVRQQSAAKLPQHGRRHESERPPRWWAFSFVGRRDAGRSAVRSRRDPSASVPLPRSRRRPR
jgi:hypothetical protein